MKVRISHRSGTFRTLLALTWAACLLSAQPVLAQQEDEATESPPMVEEEILVTGTRIEGLDLTGAAQAVQVNRDDILESGAENLGQLMQDLTVTGGGAGTFTTSTAGPLLVTRAK